MAMIGFPLHVPRVPLRWDEPIWMHELAMNTDERIVQVIRTKRNNEANRISYSYLPDDTVGIMVPRAEEDDHNGVDAN
ncbi:hypothetical protein WR25_03776 [Diploscapter pachys]|uniref:Uncharacterized protein n=1 Tax=Diploscapter pachys TaxID=2018661 RepID=A0A2A2LNP4_9BILA|nr:hypothetical protein WR25_03776 [Diploscapter pachys]